MEDNIIKLLPTSAYRTFKGWITETGNINPVFVASFQHPLESKPIDMYVKLYSFQHNDRSVFNEIVGYLMADALGLPQPKYACIALIPTKQLKLNVNFKFKNVNLAKEIFNNEVFPVFCTSKINPSQTAFQYYKFAQVVANEFAKWSDYSKAIAMDNTICHADRHMNNVLRTGPNKYHLIDNGILVDPNGWQPSHLDSTANFTNKLLGIAQNMIPPNKYNNIKSEAILACHDHKQAFNKITDELRYWINALYGPYQSDYNKFLDFLDQRATAAYPLLSSRLQMLI